MPMILPATPAFSRLQPISDKNAFSQVKFGTNSPTNTLSLTPPIRPDQSVSVGDIFNSISHDMKTPIQVILGLTNHLKSTALHSEQIAEYMEMLERQGLILNSMVMDLLSIGRELGSDVKLPLSYAPLDPAKMFETLAYETDGPANRKLQAVKLDNRVAKGEVVMGDQSKLQTVLNNLVSNAIRYTPEGSLILVTADIQNEAKNRYLVFTVRDSGNGLSPEVMDKLFKKKERNQKETGSTGLGLYLCNQFVQAHGGSIEVDSNPGRGTTFRVKIPADNA
jgi:signal transduction histidine kinase